MSAEVIVALIAIGVTILGALIAVLIRVFVALEHLTGATNRLVGALDDHDERIDSVENTVSDHEKRIVKIETTGKLKGCLV